ncbi:hypothetical protein [Acinetobacter sp. GXMZU3951]
MAKRDINLTIRNKEIQKIKNELRLLQANVFEELPDRASELKLNAYVGSKAADFIDLKHEVIDTPQKYILKWLEGMKDQASKTNRANNIFNDLQDENKPHFKKYVHLFLTRSFLNYYNELSKVRPDVNDAHLWFGNNDNFYGFFITPRWNQVKQEWENDNSEIRAVQFKYWSIGHILKTGLCIPDKDQKYTFTQLSDFLNFYMALIKLTKSPYQIYIAEQYITYIKGHSNPEDLPLLIPEMRFGGKEKKHLYRLDFMVINAATMEKTGFEISPWSTHGQLSGKSKTLVQLNEEAQANFQKEIDKSNRFLKRYQIPTFHYSDRDLLDLDTVWLEIQEILETGKAPEQLELALYNDIFGNI